MIIYCKTTLGTGYCANANKTLQIKLTGRN